MDKKNILSIKNLKKVYSNKQAEDTHALNDLNLDVQEGEIFGLLGPNGAGKTTLFNCLSRLYTLNSGDVRFKGNSILGLRADQIAPIGIGRRIGGEPTPWWPPWWRYPYGDAGGPATIPRIGGIGILPGRPGTCMPA